MKRIDAHQHFWKFNPVRDSWINEDMKSIQRDFLPEDLWPLLDKHGFEGCVAIQTTESERETDFLISLAKKYAFIKGVVGWVDLQADDIMEKLQWYKSFSLVKGFRYFLQHPQRDLMLRPEFKRGIAALQRLGFTYDILIFPDQLKFFTDLVTAFPEQKFVVDHLPKPFISRKETATWRSDIEELALHQNVYCKMSGIVTEAYQKVWKKEDLKPHIDITVNAFGINRVMFGSDWPVCLLAASYEEVVNIVEEYFSSFSKSEQKLFFAGNAVQFYNL